MLANDVLAWNNATPFAPYRIRLNGGRVFEVRHPEMVVVDSSMVTLVTFSDGQDGGFDRMERVALMLIKSIEPSSSVAPD